MVEAIKAWNAAGIFVVWANGNEGYSLGCNSVRFPANIGLDLFAVGATDVNDNLADFSSRGPGIESGIIKPSIVAPGVSIVSASFYDDISLAYFSGTSMAAPHVAGVVALLLTNGTELTFGEMSNFLFESASHTVPPTGKNCGGISETEYPNNAVGYGRITAAGAIAKLLESRGKF